MLCGLLRSAANPTRSTQRKRPVGVYVLLDGVRQSPPEFVRVVAFVFAAHRAISTGETAGSLRVW